MENKTSEGITNENPFNPKIMVHWEKRKIVSCVPHRGTEYYKSLIKKGYEEVGVFKGVQKGQFYFTDQYFNPEDKYQRNIDEITT